MRSKRLISKRPKQGTLTSKMALLLSPLSQLHIANVHTRKSPVRSVIMRLVIGIVTLIVLLAVNYFELSGFLQGFISTLVLAWCVLQERKLWES